MRKFYFKYLLMMLFVIPLLGIGFSANAQQDSCNVYLSISGDTLLSCNNPTANITANVYGGTAPYSYAWNDGSMSQTISPYSTGVYVVTVVDSYGCSAYASTVITEDYNAPEVYITSFSGTTMLTCSNTQIMLSAEGDAETFTWSNGSTSRDFIVYLPGMYTLTGMGANGCTSTATIDIMGDANPPTIMIESNDIYCNGGTATATANVTGGSAPYSYMWSNGETTQTISDISAEQYNVIVSDNGGCTASSSIVFTEPPMLDVYVNQSTITICSGSSATITATVMGGTPSYIYAWNDGSATSEIIATPSLSTNYLLTVTDANGCTASQSVMVEVSAPLYVTVNSNDILCNGGTTDATVVVNGGAEPYTYNWNNYLTVPDATLHAGDYSVTVVDSYGCSATYDFIVTEPEVFEASITSTSIQCNGANDGSATVTVMGGMAPYTYNWGAISAQEPTVTGLGAGTYSVAITDANGCSVTQTVIIDQPPMLDVYVTPSTTTICSGSSANITATAMGGTPSYMYEWNDGSTTSAIEVTPFSTTNYSLTVTDANGCSASQSVTVEVSAPLDVMVNGSDFALACNGGTTEATVVVNGGAEPYIYSWSNGANGATATIGAGDYIVTVTDSNGCTASYSFTVIEPEVFSASITSTPIQCYGENTGSATVTVTGGTAPYTYNWGTIMAQEPTITGLAAGTYSVAITDANGCSVTQNVIIDQPELLALSVSAGTIACGDSTTSIATVIEGGTAPYIYEWSNGSTASSLQEAFAGVYYVTVVDANGCSVVQTIEVASAQLVVSVNAIPITCGDTTANVIATVESGTAPYTYSWSNGSTESSLQNVSAGVYVLTVVDSNGCSVAQTATVEAPDVLTIAVNSNDVTCNGGMADAEVVVDGGSAPYTYTWNNGTIGATANLGAGDYIVTVTDASGCTATAQLAIVEPEAITVALTAGTITCAEPTTTITATTIGGVAPYLYQWSDGSVSDAIDNALEGVYYVTVVDANGCSASASVEIDGIVGITASVSVVNAQNSDIANGAANVAVVGGIAPYRVVMSQETASYEYVFMENNFVINNLPAATYSLSITDANGCMANVNFTIENICNVSVAEQVTDNGTMLHFENVVYPVTVYVDGNTNGTATEDGYMLQNVENGVHNVFVADANGCFANISVFVEGINCDNVSIMASVSVTSTTSTTNPNGTAVVTAEGGEAPYSFTWSNGNMGDSATDLYQGVYTVVVTDANGCVGTTSFEINYEVQEEEFDELYVTLDYHLEMEQTYTDEGISVIPVAVVYAQAFGGSAPYAYSWMAAGADNGCYFKMYESGSVCVEVRDEQNNAVNGCIYVDVPVVSEDVTNEIVEEVSQAVDSCFDARFVKAQVLDYEIDSVNGDCVVTWELFDVNGNVHNIDIAYPLDSALSGIYAFNLYFTCNGGRLVTSFSVRLYIEVEDGGDPVSVEEIVVTSASAYPNPFTDIINVEIESAISEDVEISVVNLSGQVVYMTNKYLSAGLNSFEINADNYVSGVYFIRINGTQINETMKMVK